jgi:hypothetical protein
MKNRAEDDIEQKLDMKERGPLRGEEVLRQHHTSDTGGLTDRFAVDMAEKDREGDEMSGDEHSGGLQGGDSELVDQPHIDSGLPGDRRWISGDSEDVSQREEPELLEDENSKKTA